MPIVVSQLVSAAMLQDPFVDKEGKPLADGLVIMTTMDKVTLKNWYYDAGTPGNPSYIALPNPMTLSAAGTIVDVNGEDTIPFYYPWSETNPNVAQLYFVRVFDQFGTEQFTRINFPSHAGGGGITPTSGTLTNENYIVNNRFWRNTGPNALDLSTLPNTWTTQYNNTGTVYSRTLAPDQHDGFSMPDFNYIRNTQVSMGNIVENVSFLTFPKTSVPSITGDIQPEFYLNHTTVSDTSGSVFKAYQFPITLHQATLANQSFSFTIQTQWLSGAANVSFYLYQFNGTGVASTSSPPIFLGQFNFTTAWTKFTLTGLTFPSVAPVLGSDGAGGSDDAFYLQIRVPVGVATSLNFTLPSIYITNGASGLPANSFATYDQIDDVIAAPRTGDVKISLNTFYPFGWAPMNDGTLCRPNSTATTIMAPTGVEFAYQGQDSWPLFNLIWTAFANTKLAGSNLITIYDKTGTPTIYGANAYTDWQAFKQLTLTKTMGQVILGTAPVSALADGYDTGFTGSNSGGKILLTASNPIALFAGMPFIVIGGSIPDSLALNTVYYVSAIPAPSSTVFQVSTTFANAMAGTTIAYGSTNGSGSIILANAGNFAGEYAHLQLTAEVGVHSHNFLSTPSQNYSGVNQGGFQSGGAVTALVQGNTLTANSAANSAFNVTQPSTFYNMFIKL